MDITSASNISYTNYYNTNSSRRNKSQKTTSSSKNNNSIGTNNSTSNYCTATYSRKDISNTNPESSTSTTYDDPKKLKTYGDHYLFIDLYENWAVTRAKGMKGNRNFTDKSLNEIFEHNNIEIPEGTTLTFSVSSYDYYVTVSGIDDEELKSRIEQVLNYAENGKQLYNHIYSSNYIYETDNPTYLGEKSSGTSEGIAINFIRKLTGYDLRECTLKDGEFYAPDGTNVKEALIETYKNNDGEYTEEELDMNLKRIDDIIVRMGNNGGRLVYDDYCLNIDYTDGHLYDKNEKGYGPGQTQWIDKLISKHGAKKLATIINGKSVWLDKKEEKSVQDILFDRMIDWIYSDDSEAISLEDDSKDIDDILLQLGITKDEYDRFIELLNYTNKKGNKFTLNFFRYIFEQSKTDNMPKVTMENEKLDIATVKKRLRDKFENFMDQNNLELDNLSTENKQKVEDYLVKLGSEYVDITTANPHLKQYSPYNKTV
ncbi:hypothetical protein SH1V18_40220 [Vallitalea longa]|uniref:Uncharacterized protein n=1 Tax=Vallitalea longa TaxID=2936439 RepID=A0A9W5YDL0_9FIRM|nr:DUF4885 family protein [Vallitalea longa]GKX31542.1 hypothetical protein SH1V18_40220 [Vallitalea longa]